jgi:hypothetical protein
VRSLAALRRKETVLHHVAPDVIDLDQGADQGAGHLRLKIAERRGAMLGTDAPTRINAVQLRQVVPEQTSTEESETRSMS